MLLRNGVSLWCVISSSINDMAEQSKVQSSPVLSWMSGTNPLMGKSSWSLMTVQFDQHSSLVWKGTRTWKEQTVLCQRSSC